MSGESIPPIDGALARVLDGYHVPGLSADFVNRLEQAAMTSAPLPRLRPSAGRWRGARRLVLGVAAGGLLASAAAATGLLERVGIALPPIEHVWARLGGDSAPALAAEAAKPKADLAGRAVAPIRVEGTVDSPEELEAAFAQADARRAARVDERRNRVDARVDRRIATASDRREAQGKPRLTTEQEAKIRQAIEARRAEADRAQSDRREARRDSLRQRVEAGEVLDPQAMLRQRREARAARDPAERRSRLRAAIRERREGARSEPSDQPMTPQEEPAPSE